MVLLLYISSRKLIHKEVGQYRVCFDINSFSLSIFNDFLRESFFEIKLAIILYYFIQSGIFPLAFSDLTCFQSPCFP